MGTAVGLLGAAVGLMRGQIQQVPLAPETTAVATPADAPIVAGEGPPQLPDDGGDAAATPETTATENAQPASSPFDAIEQPPPAPPPRTGMTSYTVVADDVLWQVAERFQLRPETLLWSNPDIQDPNLLIVGQSLVIPPTDGIVYTVQPGDQLTDISQRYGIDSSDIASANSIADSDNLPAGSDIFLPNARPLRAPTQAVADGVVSEPSDSAGQTAAVAVVPQPLPENISALLSAGWLRADTSTTLYRTAADAARPLGQLPAGARLERLEGFTAGRIQVRDPGDGKTREAMTGWVDALAVDVGSAPPARELPQAYPADAAMDIAQVFAPYRTQLDGTPYAAANCGPATIGMALDAFGITLSSGQLRTEALNAQRMWGNGVGTLITALADVVESHGLRTLDLFTADGAELRRWTVDDIRTHVSQGHPVVVQVRYRSLPGRGGALFFGDHYILITGVLGNGSFLYNDAINADGVGWDRAIPADRLLAAMNASDKRYAYAAFAVSR